VFDVFNACLAAGENSDTEKLLFDFVNREREGKRVARSENGMEGLARASANMRTHGERDPASARLPGDEADSFFLQRLGHEKPERVSVNHSRNIGVSSVCRRVPTDGGGDSPGTARISDDAIASIGNRGGEGGEQVVSAVEFSPDLPPASVTLLSISRGAGKTDREAITARGCDWSDGVDAMREL